LVNTFRTVAPDKSPIDDREDQAHVRSFVQILEAHFGL
jgi:hypothetical protein